MDTQAIDLGRLDNDIGLLELPLKLETDADKSLSPDTCILSQLVAEKEDF